MRKRLFSWLAVAVTLIFMALPVLAATNWDGYYTNMLVKGYLGGKGGATLDDQTAYVWKFTGGSASGYFYIYQGNLKVGNGTPDVTLNGDDAYIKGQLEVDGAVQLDGALTGTAGATVSGGTINLNASSNNAVNIGTGTTTSAVTIGGAGTQSIDIGNGAAAKTVALGSSNTTSTTTILSGSGAVNINVDNNQPVNVGTGTSTGTVTIGGAGAQSIAIGDGAAAKTVTLGSTNTTSTTTINAGSGGVVVTGTIDAQAGLTVTGATNLAAAVLSGASPLILDGVTAEATNRVTVAVTDPTAARTLTIPDATGTINLNGTASHDYGAAAADWNLSASEGLASYIVVTNANGACQAHLAAAVPGKTYVIYNNSGQTLTFKVEGQTGGTIATGKHAFYVAGATDVIEIYEQP